MTMDKKRILIVDDEPSITRLLKLALERRGDYQVHTVNCGLDALLAARNFEPNLILLDIMMPHLSGADVAAQLRLDPCLGLTPVIFLTAAVRKEELGGVCGKIGGRRFVAKPLNVSEILSVVDEALANTALTPSHPPARHSSEPHSIDS
jgi:two-component system, OmpR family, response regulator